MPNNSYLNFYYDKQGDVTTYYSNPFTITSLYDNLSVSVTISESGHSLRYSLDNGITWTDIVGSGNYPFVHHINISKAGQQLQIIGTNTSMQGVDFSLSSSHSNTGLVNFSGNLGSLLTEDYSNSVEMTTGCFEQTFMDIEVVDASKLIMPTDIQTECFKEMFRDCAYLKKAPNLNGSAAEESCFEGMFRGCWSLETPPIINIGVLADSCYKEMFKGCESLTTPPELPVTTLAERCYERMFEDCVNLVEMPNLPGTTLANYCYQEMFKNCNSITTPKDLPASSLEYGCYLGMFEHCTSLTRAPELLATTLADYCYAYMFKECANLNYIKCLAYNFGENSVYYWVQDVADYGIFVESAGAEWLINSVHGIPIGWRTTTDETEYTSRTVTVVVSPVGSGTVVGGGQYDLGDICTLTATPENGYVFEGYYINNELLSGLNVISFDVNSNVTVEARFVSDGRVWHALRFGYVLNTTSPIELSIQGHYLDNTVVTLVAPEIERYLPAHWYYKKHSAYVYSPLETDDLFSVDISMDDDYDVYVRYEAIPVDVIYTVTLSTSPYLSSHGFEWNGDLSYDYNDNGMLQLKYRENDTATITAHGNQDWEFDYWQYNGIEFSTDATISFAVTQDVHLIAMFKQAPYVYENEYLTFQALYDGTTIYVNVYNGECFDLQYNLGITPAWRNIECELSSANIYVKYNQIYVATLNAGQTIRFRANRNVKEDPIGSRIRIDEDFDFAYNIGSRFSTNNPVDVWGNLLSMFKYNDTEDWRYYTQPQNVIVPAYTFAWFFCEYIDTYDEISGTISPTRNGINIHDARHLVIKGFQIRYNGFRDMFKSSGLSRTPLEIDVDTVTSMDHSIFKRMFYGCENIKSGPVIDELFVCTPNCYEEMFAHCHSLVTPPILSYTTLADSCYKGMFYDCQSLNVAPTLPATTLAVGCYEEMFAHCDSLITAPALPATTLAEGCYNNMFQGCSSLINAPALPATTLADRCYMRMFGQCKSLVNAPILPATTLADKCYEFMFEDCTNLSYIFVKAEGDFRNTIVNSYPENDYFYNWTGQYSYFNRSGVSSNGVFIQSENAIFDIDDPSGIPDGWTIYNYEDNDYPSPSSQGTSTLLYQASFENLAPEDVPWSDAGAEYTPNSTMTATSEGLVMYIPDSTEYWAPQVLLMEDEDMHLQQGHNYKVECYLKANCTDINYDIIHCSIGETSDIRMDSPFEIIDTGSDFLKVTFDFYNFNDESHGDPDDTSHTVVLLQFGDFRGTVTIADMKLYEYGDDQEEQHTPRYNVNVIYDSNMGTISGNGVYPKGDQALLVATPKTGYAFDKWIKEGVIVSYNNTLTVDVNYNETYEAIFVLDEHTSQSYDEQYFTIEQKSGGASIFKFGAHSRDPYTSVHGTYMPEYDTKTIDTFNLYYSVSLDTTGDRWTEWKKITIGPSIRSNTWIQVCELNNGYKVRIHTDAKTLTCNRYDEYEDTVSDGVCTMSLVKKGGNTSTTPLLVNVYGNILSLIDQDSKYNDNVNFEHPVVPDFTNNTYAYNKSMFLKFFRYLQIYDASNLVLPNLISVHCYEKMFYNNSYLVSAPTVLPATTLATECYNNMFYACTSLVNAPALPATTLADSCYNNMFNGCTSLVNAPALPATETAEKCCYYMFNGCTSLVNAPALPATVITKSCYEGMFNGCSSLVNAPATLPATTLRKGPNNGSYIYANGCYTDMFNGCTSLVNAPALPATILAVGCYLRMFYGCTSLINAPILPAINHIGTNPDQPDWNNYKNCCRYMFCGCTSLASLTCLHIANYYNYGPSRLYPEDYYHWLDNTAEYGIFYYHPEYGNLQYWPAGQIPSTWTIQPYTPE